MTSGLRLIALGLSATVYLSSTGCTTSAEEASEERQYLYPGMSMDEVTAHLGEPAQVIKTDTETVWVYRFEGGGTNVIGTIALVIVFVAIIAVLALSKSGGGSFGGGGGGGSGPPTQIRVRFGADNRLIDVSAPEPVPGN